MSGVADRRPGLLTRLGLWPAALVLAGLQRFVCGSLRIQTVIGQQHLDELIAKPRTLIPCAWHQTLFTSTWFLQRSLAKVGFPITYLASHSRDGELAATMARLVAVRASRASRGGVNLCRRPRARIPSTTQPPAAPDLLASAILMLPHDATPSRETRRCAAA